MLKATYKKHILQFKQASGTSRGVMTEKETWFIILEENGKKGTFKNGKREERRETREEKQKGLIF